MPDPSQKPLRFEIGQDETQLFTLLFQYGVHVRCTTGVTIEKLLVEHFGIAREYLEEKLTTVFLDGSAVDDIGEALVFDGTTLALSSAMPGLAGATLRRKGMLSSMRRSITHHDEGRHTEAAHDGFVTIKLFNVLAGEIGTVFLRHGVCIEAAKLAGFISLSPQKARLVSVMSRNATKDAEEFMGMLKRHGDRKVEIVSGL